MTQLNYDPEGIVFIQQLNWEQDGITLERIEDAGWEHLTQAAKNIAANIECDRTVAAMELEKDPAIRLLKVVFNNKLYDLLALAQSSDSIDLKKEERKELHDQIMHWSLPFLD